MTLIGKVWNEDKLNNYMKQDKNEQWLTKQYLNKPYKRMDKKKTFASGLMLSLDKPQTELDKILFPIIKKHL